MLHSKSLSFFGYASLVFNLNIGVGFDINCGVRLLRTSLTEEEVKPVKEQLTQALFKTIPLGVGSEGGLLEVNKKELDEVLNRGMEYHKQIHLFYNLRLFSYICWKRVLFGQKIYSLLKRVEGSNMLMLLKFLTVLRYYSYCCTTQFNCNC